MNRKIHRSLVLGTCFSKPPASHWSKQVKRIHGNLLLERWGLLIDNIVDVLCVQTPLVSYWDEPRIFAGTKAQRQKRSVHKYDDEDDDEVSPEELCDLASTFVLDSDLWAYGNIIVFGKQHCSAVGMVCQQLPLSPSCCESCSIFGLLVQDST